MISLNGRPFNITMFPDNTSQVWKLDEFLLKETNWVHIRWDYSYEGEFLQIAQLKNLLDRHNIRSALRITYLPYARQDKPIENNATFALRTFASLLNFLQFEEVIIQDPHSEVAIDLINNSRAYYPKEHVEQVIIDHNIDVVCYPDKGAVHKYTQIYDYPWVHGNKVRDQLTGNITSYELVGDVKGRNVLIVDDICDGGMTFKILAKDLLANGATSVVLFVTHGIYSKGVRTLYDSGIKAVYDKDGCKGPRFGSTQV